MTANEIIEIFDLWVTRYLAIFCLLSLCLWGAFTFFLVEKWARPLRDIGIVLAVISLLTLVQAVRPAQLDVLFWSPVIWFSFAMLLMMELLWISYLVESVITAIRKAPERITQTLLPPAPPPVSHLHK